MIYIVVPADVSVCVCVPHHSSPNNNSNDRSLHQRNKMNSISLRLWIDVWPRLKFIVACVALRSQCDWHWMRENDSDLLIENYLIGNERWSTYQAYDIYQVNVEQKHLLSPTAEWEVELTVKCIVPLLTVTVYNDDFCFVFGARARDLLLWHATTAKLHPFKFMYRSRPLSVRNSTLRDGDRRRNHHTDRKRDTAVLCKKNTRKNDQITHLNESLRHLLPFVQCCTVGYVCVYGFSIRKTIRNFFIYFSSSGFFWHFDSEIDVRCACVSHTHRTRRGQNTPTVATMIAVVYHTWTWT